MTSLQKRGTDKLQGNELLFNQTVKLQKNHQHYDFFGWLLCCLFVFFFCITSVPSDILSLFLTKGMEANASM